MTAAGRVCTLPRQSGSLYYIHSFTRGRITFALYQQMNVLDCVAASPQDYIKMALRLGTDRAYREAIRSKILAANGVLFENSVGIHELEQFFLQAVAATARN